MEEAKLDPSILTTRLYNATLVGDVNSLQNLLQEDPLILDRCIIQKPDRFMQSPLHVASYLGHLEFAIELLRLKPELAEQLDLSARSSPLHLASAKGHLDVVEKLLEVNPNMCLARDQDGRNPVHVAAVSCQLHVLNLLVRKSPHAARERTNVGETVLHLCVKYAQLEALKYLVNVIDDSELLNAKDANDNTVLHLAVVANQLDVVKFLVTNKKLHYSIVNKNGLTTIEWLIQNGKSQIDMEIMRTLKRAKKLEGKQVLKQKTKDDKWLKKQSNTLMIVASLIATMAFQIGVNPPGGAFQDDSSPDHPDGQIPHLIGTSIMANRDPIAFDSLKTVNTISLISSLSVVLLLISGLPCKRLFVSLLMITMGVATTTTAVTYSYSLSYLQTKIYDQGSAASRGPSPAPSTQNWAIFVPWSGALILFWAIILTGYVIRVLFQPVKNLVQLVKEKVA